MVCTDFFVCTFPADILMPKHGEITENMNKNFMYLQGSHLVIITLYF